MGIPAGIERPVALTQRNIESLADASIKDRAAIERSDGLKNPTAVTFVREGRDLHRRGQRRQCEKAGQSQVTHPRHM